MDLFQNFGKNCPKNICKPPSVCEPLEVGGFYCKGCSGMDYHNKFCELTTRRFFKGSYLTFPSIKQRNHFKVQLKWVFSFIFSLHSSIRVPCSFIFYTSWVARNLQPAGLSDWYAKWKVPSNFFSCSVHLMIIYMSCDPFLLAMQYYSLIRGRTVPVTTLLGL